MSQKLANHTITNIQFTKGVSSISAVGPLIGSGANGETTSLLKADDGDVEGRILAVQNMMSQLKKGDEALAGELAKSLQDLASSITPVEAEPEVPTEVAEGGDAPIEGGEPVPASAAPVVATPDVAPAASETPVTPQPSLVVKSEKENDMTPEEIQALQAKADEQEKQLARLTKAEDTRMQAVCLKKAQGLAPAIGDENVEALSKALFAIEGVDAMEPILSALDKAANLMANADELKTPEGHAQQLTKATGQDLVNEHFQTLKKAAVDAGDKVDIKALYRQASEMADQEV